MGQAFLYHSTCLQAIQQIHSYSMPNFSLVHLITGFNLFVLAYRFLRLMRVLDTFKHSFHIFIRKLNQYGTPMRTIIWIFSFCQIC